MFLSEGGIITGVKGGPHASMLSKANLDYKSLLIAGKMLEDFGRNHTSMSATLFATALHWSLSSSAGTPGFKPSWPWYPQEYADFLVQLLSGGDPRAFTARSRSKGSATWT